MAAVAQNRPRRQFPAMDALALLRLQIEWGADEAIVDDPVERLRAPEPAAARPAAPAAPRPTPGAAPRPAEAPRPAAERAQAAADGANTIDELRAAIAAFDGCALRDTATSAVFLAGDWTAPALLVGEAPTADDDRAGAPFSGAEGAYLDKMLASAGLSRAGLLLAPLIPWRPPGGRAPREPELAQCLPFLRRAVVLARPRRVVLLGRLAEKALLNTTVRRRAASGWIDWVVPELDAPIPTWVLPSVSALMRTPSSRKDAWTAWRALRRFVDTQ